MSASVIVRFLMVMGNMKIVYQKESGDASKKCREMKNIFYGCFMVRNIGGGIALNAIPWVETKNCGLKMSLKSRIERF